MPFFKDIPLLPVDPILGLPIAFAEDPRTHKINLGIGAYQTADGKPLVLSSVRKAESLIHQKHLNKEYLPIDGDSNFINASLPLLFGDKSPLFEKKTFFCAQTVGGAGALRIGGEFLSKLVCKTIYIPQPSWSNHKQIFEKGGLTVGSYPYFDPQTKMLDFEGMCQAIETMQNGDAILLHACCHNPTGIDPSMEQWRELSQKLKKRQILPFFDFAYQGFGDSLEEDAAPIRHFIAEGHEMLVAYSFSKNFGLYGERIGFLTLVSNEIEKIQKIGSQIKLLIRSNYSNPPLHGARIVSTILKSTELTMEWKAELLNMSERVKEMRKALIAALQIKITHIDLSYLKSQKGLFCFMGLTLDQVNVLKNEKAIYVPNNGRINVAGLNMQHLAYVAEALQSVI